MRFALLLQNILKSLSTLGIFAAIPAVASQPVISEPSPGMACATLKDLSGDVQVLNLERTESKYVEIQGSIFCEEWLEIKDGYAKIELSNGTEVRILSDSMVRVSDDVQKLVLYRGRAVVVTPNVTTEIFDIRSKFKMNPNTIALIESQPGNIERGTSTLLVLRGSGEIRNRYLHDAFRKVLAGKMSSFGADLSDAFPVTPKSPKIPMVQEWLELAQVPRSEAKILLSSVKPDGLPPRASVDRKIASVESDPKKSQSLDAMAAKGSDLEAKSGTSLPAKLKSRSKAIARNSGKRKPSSVSGSMVDEDTFRPTHFLEQRKKLLKDLVSENSYED